MLFLRHEGAWPWRRCLSVVKYAVNTEPGRVSQPPIPVDRGPSSDSIGTTFFESVTYVLIVDPHLSMTQAGEERTDRTQEGPLVNRWVLTVVCSPLPPPPPALQAGLGCKGFQRRWR